MQGMTALQKRLKAIGETRPVLRVLQLSVIHEAQALAPRKTGTLQRSIVPGELTDTHATVVSGAPYSRYVEEGTGLYGPKHQRIDPGKVMRWAGGGSSKVRLTGRSRTKGGKAVADVVFARSTKGSKAQPFLFPGARKAVEKAGLAQIVVKAWDSAA